MNKKKKALLFDLDGTLLPMDNDRFTKVYFGLLAEKMAPYGYEKDRLIEGLWICIEAMVRNDGSKTNEEAFWERFGQFFGEKAREDYPVFEEFYRNEFQKSKSACGFDERSAKAVRLARQKGLRVILATNPLFPVLATHSRIGWAGLKPEEFELITTYENIGFCKPNPEYYKEILTRQDLKPQECIMIGNNVEEDMVAAGLGMDVFLLTDHMINRKNKDISVYPHGGFDRLLQLIEELEVCQE
ncbi:MAG: HAD family hydrolase [Lachnospiraceae bacterium]